MGVGGRECAGECNGCLTPAGLSRAAPHCIAPAHAAHFLLLLCACRLPPHAARALRLSLGRQWALPGEWVPALHSFLLALFPHHPPYSLPRPLFRLAPLAPRPPAGATLNMQLVDERGNFRQDNFQKMRLVSVWWWERE